VVEKREVGFFKAKLAGDVLVGPPLYVAFKGIGKQHRQQQNGYYQPQQAPSADFGYAKQFFHVPVRYSA
jgi:hypothetical protein